MIIQEYVLLCVIILCLCLLYLLFRRLSALQKKVQESDTKNDKQHEKLTSDINDSKKHTEAELTTLDIRIETQGTELRNRLLDESRNNDRRYEQATKALNTISSEISDFKKSIRSDVDKTIKAMEGTRKDVDAVRDTIKDIVEAHKKHDAELKEVVGKIEALESSRDLTTKNMEQTKKMLMQAVEDVARGADDIMASVAKLEFTVKRHETDVADYRKFVDGSVPVIEELERRMSVCERNINVNSADIKSLQDNITSINQNIRKLKESIFSQSEIIESIEKKANIAIKKSEYRAPDPSVIDVDVVRNGEIVQREPNSAKPGLFEGFKNVVKGIGTTAKNIVQGAASTAKSIWGGIKKLFSS
jgi:chromosome segregation ATPase